MKLRSHITAVSLQGGRANNEDNFYVKKRYPEIITRDERYAYTTKQKISCFAVADGMGGVSNGEVASSVVIKYLSNHVGLLKKNPNKFFYKANKKVKKICKFQGGTTFSCAIINKDNTIDVFTIGDSPVFLYKYATEELFQVNELDNKAAELNKEACDPLMYENAKRFLTKFLGCSAFEFDVPFHNYKIETAPGDIVILATDGVDTLTSAEIKCICENRGRNYPNIAEALAQTAVCNAARFNEQRSDNVTVVAVEFLG